VRTVLVVDDEPRIVELARDYLEHAGFAVLTAADGPAALMTARTLLADVSHELRTPLAVLRGDLEAMLDGIHPTDHAHIEAAAEEIGLLTQLVEDLRTLALAEAGTLPLHIEPTDVAILAQDSAAAFDAMAEEAGVKLEVDVVDDLPLVDLDPLRIRQVLVNLIANALHYAPAGSAIRLTGKREGGTVIVSVADEGKGIAPELRPHLFERFAKSDDSRGSGLGLVIARRVVEAHGGTIRAELGTEPADAPSGTVIRFEIPIERRAQTRGDPAAADRLRLSD
jgi:two-component system sensor histidine kinase BaeS